MIDRLGEGALIDALRSLPSISLTMDRKDLMDPATGIYVNAEERGSDWERPAFLEFLPGNGKDGASANCGVRIRGGISRGGEFPKHSLRLFFRKQYGDAKLRYRLFEDEGTDEFDNIDLRTSTNWDWASLGYFQEGALQNSLLRDISSRDTQGAVGSAYTRSRYYHLIRWSSVTGKTYRLESAESMGSNADWKTVSTHTADGEEIETRHAMESNGLGNRFYRVVVE